MLTQYKIKIEIGEDVSSQFSCMQVTNQWHSCLRRDEICGYFLKYIKQVSLVVFSGLRHRAVL
jgi:hypothetical protein